MTLKSIVLLIFIEAKTTQVEIKFRKKWLDQMSNKASSQYKLMDGNIVDAVSPSYLSSLNVLLGHSLKSTKEKAKKCETNLKT